MFKNLAINSINTRRTFTKSRKFFSLQLDSNYIRNNQCHLDVECWNYPKFHETWELTDWAASIEQNKCCKQKSGTCFRFESVNFGKWKSVYRWISWKMTPQPENVEVSNFSSFNLVILTLQWNLLFQFSSTAASAGAHDNHHSAGLTEFNHWTRIRC